MHFDLHRLRLLRELSHRGTLAAVAEAMAYSPSSVSQQLAQLEVEVGVPLLEPVGRRVRLTEQARILVEHTEAVLHRLEQAEADVVRSFTELTGTVRVALFQTAALAWLPGVLDRLHADHPGLRLRVTVAEPDVALPALLARDYDLVVAEEYPDAPLARPPGVELTRLCADPLRLAVPPGTTLPGIATGGLRAVADLPWAMELPGSPQRHWATALCRAAGFEPDVRFESADVAFHRSLVERGHAVAVLPDLVWAGHPPTVGLHRLPRGHRDRTLLAAVREGAGSHPAIQACREAFRDQADHQRLPTAPTGVERRSR